MVFVIVNPKSGRGGGDLASRGARRSALARRVLDEAGVGARIEVTTHQGHARALAAEAVAAGASLVLVWGGDGTVNEVAGALAYGPVPLGIVPAGSGNGLAAALGLDRRPEHAIHAAIGGRDRTIDAGELDGRLFFNLMGVGFDAHVAAVFNARGLRRGLPAYVFTTLSELLRYAPRTYHIRLDGDTLERRALMVVVANGTQYGNGARVAPDARLDDGELDLVVVDARTPWQDLARVRYLFDGTAARRPGIMHRRVRRATIAAVEGTLAYHVDGECHERAGTLDVHVRPAALKVRVPGNPTGQTPREPGGPTQ